MPPLNRYRVSWGNYSYDTVWAHNMEEAKEIVWLKREGWIAGFGSDKKKFLDESKVKKVD